MSRRAVILILSGIIVIALGLRLYGLDKQSLWYDEIIEETAFQRLFLHFNPNMPPENTPPLNSFFIYLAKQIFSGSDFALRTMPFIFGLISVPLLFLLARQLFNEKVGLIASFLLAISPFHIWYSQDARMYALQWMLALVSLIYFVKAMEKPSRGNYIGYGISTVAGLYTHQLTIFLVLLQGLYLLLFMRTYKSQFFKWIGTFSMVVILYLPWIIYSLTSLMDRPAGFSKEANLKAILYTIYTYSAGFSMGPSLRELHLNQSLSVIKPYLLEIVSLMIFYGTLFVLGLWSIRKERPQFSLLLLILIVPIAGALILDRIIPNISYNVRYTGTALLAFLLFVANGIKWLTCLKPNILGKTLVVFAIITVTGFSVYSYSNYQFNKKYQKPDFRGAAAYINKKIMADDVVLCLINGWIINRYSQGGFECSGFPLNSVNNKKELDEVMRKIVEKKKRLWLVLSDEWYMANISNVKTWLDLNYEEIKELHKGVTEIANIQIFCYDLTREKNR